MVLGAFPVPHPVDLLGWSSCPSDTGVTRSLAPPLRPLVIRLLTAGLHGCLTSIKVPSFAGAIFRAGLEWFASLPFGQKEAKIGISRHR